MTQDRRSIPIVGARPGSGENGSGARTAGGPYGQERSGAGADITLVNMNLLYIRLGDGIDHEAHPPLGLLYLTSVLEQQGFCVDLVDYQILPRSESHADPFEIDTALAFIGRTAEVVGFSCMANLLPFTLLVAQRLKQRHPEKKILLGGVGPFGVESLILERFAWIDGIVRGEAETTLPLLLKTQFDPHRLFLFFLWMKQLLVVGLGGPSGTCGLSELQRTGARPCLFVALRTSAFICGCEAVVGCSPVKEACTGRGFLVIGC